MPVVIIAGAGDKVVFKRRSERLAASIRGSTLRIIKDAGHMAHHFAPRQVAQTVEDVIAAAGAELLLATSKLPADETLV